MRPARGRGEAGLPAGHSWSDGRPRGPRAEAHAEQTHSNVRQNHKEFQDGSWSLRDTRGLQKREQNASRQRDPRERRHGTRKLHASGWAAEGRAVSEGACRETLSGPRCPGTGEEQRGRRAVLLGFPEKPAREGPVPAGRRPPPQQERGCSGRPRAWGSGGAGVCS